jgi:CRISPR-associated protein Cmr1
VNIARFYDTESLECAIEFLTPAFLGGPDQNAELRAAPFKAALRYWWRILYGNSYTNPAELKVAEDALFGSTELGAKVRIKVSGAIQPETRGFPRGRKISVTSKGKNFSINILDYLAYGHYEYRRGEGNAYLHTHLPVNREFRITVITPMNVKDKIVACISGFLAFGGIGSRTRNGFGSLGVKNDGINGSAIRDFTKLSPVEYLTLNKKSKLYVTGKSYPTWEEALSEIGIIYKKARTSLERQHSFNRRGLIARPIEVKGENIPQHIRSGRHSKHFFLHVGKDANGYYGQILSLPILFYEQAEQSKYDAMIDDMHKKFGESLLDKTNEIINRFRGQV